MALFTTSEIGILKLKRPIVSRPISSLHKPSNIYRTCVGVYGFYRCSAIEHYYQLKVTSLKTSYIKEKLGYKWLIMKCSWAPFKSLFSQIH